MSVLAAQTPARLAEAEGRSRRRAGRHAGCRHRRRALQKVKDLEYLRCVLSESLRIFPPTTHGLGREVPAEGMMVDHQFIPDGTSVSISALVAHRDESVFEDPESFIPKKWLGEEGKSLQSSFLAFSTGARGCIGRNISYLEQTVLLASVIHRYDFALASPDWEIQRVEYMNLLLGNMPVKIWHRIDRHHSLSRLQRTGDLSSRLLRIRKQEDAEIGNRVRYTAVGEH